MDINKEFLNNQRMKKFYLLLNKGIELDLISKRFGKIKKRPVGRF